MALVQAFLQQGTQRLRTHRSTGAGGDRVVQRLGVLVDGLVIDGNAGVFCKLRQGSFNDQALERDLEKRMKRFHLTGRRT